MPTPTSVTPTTSGPSTSPSDSCQTLAADLKKVAGSGQIRFGYKSSTPTAKSRAAIAAAARLLTACPSVTVTVRGFADLTGSAKVNKKISVTRAQSVRTQLRALGVTNQLTVTGLGDTHSVANNSSAKGRAANRRAEIVIP
jgi:OOP family OmpA-OmpF porin